MVNATQNYRTLESLKRASEPILENAPQLSQTTVTAPIATAGPETYTAAQMFGGLIIRDTAAAARADAFDTATNIVAVIPNVVVGSSFRFSIRNIDTTPANSITLSEGAGGTLVANATFGDVILGLNTGSFLCVVDDVGTPAVTIYSLGEIVHVV